MDLTNTNYILCNVDDSAQVELDKPAQKSMSWYEVYNSWIQNAEGKNQAVRFFFTNFHFWEYEPTSYFPFCLDQLCNADHASFAHNILHLHRCNVMLLTVSCFNAYSCIIVSFCSLHICVLCFSVLVILMLGFLCCASHNKTFIKNSCCIFIRDQILV